MGAGGDAGADSEGGSGVTWYCPTCHEGEDPAECSACGEPGCEWCIDRRGICRACAKAGIK